MMWRSTRLLVLGFLLAVTPVAKGLVEITMHPMSKEAIVGREISLSCSASRGQFVQWLHNGQPITAGGGNDISSTSLTSVLEIMPFRKELAGEYRCQFSSDDGSFIALTLPGTLKYFGQDGFAKHPEDFNSYVIGSDREVIAFECCYKFDPLTTRPTITWQTCNADNTFTDVPVATEMFSSPDPRAGLRIYEFFQTNFTGYLQLLNSSNPIYNGARYRCKAASNIPGDTAEVFSECASITQHPSDATLPSLSTLPVFRTIPKRHIYLTENTKGAMACTIQNQNSSDISPLLVQNEENRTVIFNFVQLDVGFNYIPAHNLEVDYTTLQGQPDEEVTYTCRVESANVAHQTTFHIIEPPQKTMATDNVEHSCHEDSPCNLTLTLRNDSGDSFFRVYKNGRLLDIDGIRYRYTIVGVVHTLMLTSAQRDDMAVFQMEVLNLAGRIVQYNYVTVLLKARPTTPSGIIEAKVTQCLELECRATENGGGTHIDFQWSTASASNLAMFSVLAPSNEATSEYNVGNDLDVNDTGVYVCTPTNVIGSKGSVTYTVRVSKFDPPDNLTVSGVDEDSLEVMVTWNPIVVDQGMYPCANIEKYVIELHVITVNGFAKVDEVVVPGNTTSAKFSVSSVQNYQARVKACTGNRDVSDFSPFSGSSIVPVNTSEAFEGWKIFLIIFFILIFILCCILLICLLLYCLLSRQEKDTYDAEERERQYTEEKSKISE